MYIFQYRRIVPHVHGAHSKAAFDGTPLQWFTQDSTLTGPDYVTNLFQYANDQVILNNLKFCFKNCTHYYARYVHVCFVCMYFHFQEPTTLFYHDHTLGLTASNVYSGLAGFFIIRDAELDRYIKFSICFYEVSGCSLYCQAKC